VDNGPLGSDANDGLSENTPFKSLSKVSTFTKGPKTKVLLKSGVSFTGYLILNNLGGTETKPFIIDKYGGSGRPVINGNSATSAVEIQDDNIRFRNIRVTNKGGNRGIYVTPKVAGAFKNVEITGCRVEEVNWAGTDAIIDVNPSKLNVTAICSSARYVYQNGGIICDANTLPAVGASWFENIYITNNEVFKVSRTGIWLDTQWGRCLGISWGYNNYVSNDEGWYPAKNIVVQNNDISYVGGDGVVLIATRNAFIDHNKCFHANYLGRTGQFNVALWPHSSINMVMQFNEAAYTHLENGGGDGEGLDVDIACINALVQFNYVHHNDGGGLLICSGKSELGIADHRGTVVRNNVFFDNGKDAERPAFLAISSSVKSVEIYNNMILATNRFSDQRFISSADYGESGKASDFKFRNNIFFATSKMSAIFDLTYILNCSFVNNLAYNVSVNFNDSKLFNYNPGITIPNVTNGYENGLKFKPTEPKIFQNGTTFNGMSEKDMGGASTKGKKYLGAFCE
jgi:hypothetical protein